MKKVLIFDSGIGGMSILSKLNSTMKGLEVNYLADDLMFPYGTRDPKLLKKHIFEILCKAIDIQKPDMLVIACNTATYNSIERIRVKYPNILHVGVEPAVKYLASNTRTGVVGMLSTPLTNGSENIKKLVRNYGYDIFLKRHGSEVLAQITEDYVVSGKYDAKVIQQELDYVFTETDKGEKTDIVALGCTHYAFLINLFEKHAPWKVEWYEPSEAVVNQVRRLLSEENKTENIINFKYSSSKDSIVLYKIWAKLK